MERYANYTSKYYVHLDNQDLVGEGLLCRIKDNLVFGGFSKKCLQLRDGISKVWRINKLSSD